MAQISRPDYYTIMKASNGLILASTRSMEDYRNRVAYHLRTFPEYYNGLTGEHQNISRNLIVTTFADGEMEVEAPFTVRDHDVFLIAGSGRNSGDIDQNECKIELYHAIDCLKRSSPRRLTVIEPYLSPSRSDRTTRRNSVGFWIHTKTLSSLGSDSILTYQLHSDKSKTAIDPLICHMEDIPAVPMMMEYITREIIRSKDAWEKLKEKWLFCSVDAGGENMARAYSRAFDMPLIIAHKQRDYQNPNTIKAVNILSDTNIEGKVVWVVDDMIDTGGSIETLVDELVRRKVGAIHVAAIHPVLSGQAISRLKRLHQNGSLQEILFLDTINLTSEVVSELPFIRVVSSAKQTAEVIMNLHENRSLSAFFQYFSVADYLENPPLD